MKYWIIIATALLIGGCAEQIIAIPGTIAHGVGDVTSSVWDLLTGWLPGADNPIPKEV
jgi:hypothetical protein|tara:strand:- start:958 stop:1131 length:174 start_codon:yes stop_codon:yes gene_type:complete